MADEHLKDVARKMYDEVFNRGNLEAIDRYVAADFVEHEPLPPGTPPGRDGLRVFVQTMRHDFPNLKFDIQDMTVDGDQVWVRGSLHGTNQGQFMGVPVTGRTVDTSFMDVIRFRGDQAVEHWGVTDMATMMQQMGMKQMPGM